MTTLDYVTGAAGTEDKKIQGVGDPRIITTSSASKSHHPISPRSASSFRPASSYASSPSSSSSVSSKRSSSSSSKPITYGTSTLLPPSVLPPEYLHDMRETIRQRLEAMPADRETDLVAFAEWVSLFVGRTLTSHRTGLLLPPTVASSKAICSSRGKSCAAGDDSEKTEERRQRRKTETAAAAAAQQDDEHMFVVGQGYSRPAPNSPSSYSTSSAESCVDTTTVGSGMHPESEQGDEQQQQQQSAVADVAVVSAGAVTGAGTSPRPKVSGNPSDLELISILLDFSSKAKATAPQRKATPMPGSISSDSSSPSSIVSPRKTKKKASPLLPIPSRHETPHHSSVLLNTAAQAPAVIHNSSATGQSSPSPLPSTTADTHQSSHVNMSMALHKPSIPMPLHSSSSFSSPPSSSPSPSSSLSLPLPDQKTTGDATSPHPSSHLKQQPQFMASSSSSSSPTLPPPPPPSYAYFMQAGCSREGISAGNWTYFHGAGLKGQPHTNLFMGQLLRISGVPSKTQTVVAGIVRYNKDTTCNAALVLDIAESAFILTPIAPLHALLTGKYLEEEARLTIMSRLISQWLNCPARKSEAWSPSAASSASYPTPSTGSIESEASAASATSVGASVRNMRTGRPKPAIETSALSPIDVAAGGVGGGGRGGTPAAAAVPYPPLRAPFPPGPTDLVPPPHAAPKKVVPPPPSPRPFAVVVPHPQRFSHHQHFPQHQQQQQQQYPLSAPVHHQLQQQQQQQHTHRLHPQHQPYSHSSYMHQQQSVFQQQQQQQQQQRQQHAPLARA
ncbi:Hypothetical protein NocV09_02700400 [Nannochloropsis oceanica]